MEGVILETRAFQNHIFIFTLLGLWNWDIHIWCPARVFLRTSSPPQTHPRCPAIQIICFWYVFHVGLDIRSHCGMLRNAWIPFKDHVKQWMGGQRQLTQELNRPCGRVALKIRQHDGPADAHTVNVCINGASLANADIWQVNSNEVQGCVSVNVRWWGPWCSYIFLFEYQQTLSCNELCSSRLRSWSTLTDRIHPE